MPRNSDKLFCLTVNMATALLPVAMLFLLLQLGFGARPDDYIPWSSDHVDYWHEILSFKEKGFDCGYYGYEEKPARLGPYGGHGPLLPMFYGTLAKMTGWNYSTPVYYNTAFLVLSWAIFLFMLRPGLKESLFYFAFALTFTPVFYWQGALMQEPMQFSLAIVMAGLFSRAMERRTRSQATPFLDHLLISLVFLAGLFRPTWSFLFFPLFFLFRKDQSIVKPLIKAGCLMGLSAMAYATLVAPYPYDPSLLGDLIDLARGGSAAPLLEHAHYNATDVFTNRSTFYPNLVSYEILFFLGFCLAWLAWFLARGRKSEKHKGLGPGLWTTTFLVLSTIGFLFFLYVVNGSYITKHLAPVFLFGILILARHVPIKYCYLFVVINILTAPAFLSNYRSIYYTNYVRNNFISKQINTFKTSIQPFISYEKSSSPWCNTMAMTNFPGVISALPAGVAFNNIYFQETMEGPLKSRYLLIAAPEAKKRIAQYNDIELLTTTPFGELHLNKSSPCFAATK